MKRIIIVMLTLLAVSLFVSCGNDPFFFHIEFDSDGGTKVETQTVQKGEKATEPEKPTKDGMDFIGWYDGDNEFSFDTIITKDYKLTAKWKTQTPPKPTYMVTFTVTGGSVSIPAQEITEGEKAVKPETDPTHDDSVHYSFDCWTKEDGTVFDFDTDVITEDITLKAKWKNKYTIGDKGPAGGTIIYVSSNDSLTWKYVELAPTKAGEAGFGDIGTSHYTYTAVDKEADNIELIKTWAPNSSVWSIVENYKTTVDGVDYTDWTLPTKDQITQAETYLKNNFKKSFLTSSTLKPIGSTSDEYDGRFWIFSGYSLDRQSAGVETYNIYCTRRF